MALWLWGHPEAVRETLSSPGLSDSHRKIQRSHICSCSWVNIFQVYNMHLVIENWKNLEKVAQGTQLWQTPLTPGVCHVCPLFLCACPSASGHLLSP